MKFLRFLVVVCVGVLVLLGGRLCDAQVSEFADRLDEGADRLQPLNAWIHYDEYGPKYTADQISDLIAAAENDRMSGTAVLNWLERTKQTLDKDLERQRSQAGAMSNAVAAPSYEQQRQAHRLRTRDLERRAQAAQAALDCYRDGDCEAIREIDEDRAKWRRDGDPLSQDPSVPDAGDMRELLDDALRRHRSTIGDYRAKIRALKRDTLELTDAFNDFGHRLDEVEDERAKLGALAKTLRERKEKSKKLCETVRAQHEVAATRAKNADTERSTAVASINSARAGVAPCRTPADADAIELGYRAAERAHKAMGSHLKTADEALRQAREASTEWKRLANVDSERSRAREAADDAQSSVDDGRVSLDFAAAAQKRLATTSKDVADIVTTLASLSFIDDEARSWQRALADDATTQAKAKAEFSSLRSEYELLRTEAKTWIDRLAQLETRIGEFDRLEPLLDDAGLAAAKLADIIRLWRLPACDPEPSLDLRGKKLKLAELQRKLVANADVLDSARACRLAAGGSGSPSPTGPPASSGTSTAIPPPVPLPSTPTAPPPPPERYGGLVIAGLPARHMAVGDAVQLSAVDHGGRPYDSAEWVCSNQQVATLTASGVLIARQAGSVTVLAKHEGMHAFLDVTIDAPAPPDVSPQPPDSGGTGGSPGPGSGDRVPGSGASPAPPQEGGNGERGDGESVDGTQSTDGSTVSIGGDGEDSTSPGDRLPGSSNGGTAPGGDSQTGSEPPGGEPGGEEPPSTTGGFEQVGGWSEGPPPVPEPIPGAEALPSTSGGFEDVGGWSEGPPAVPGSSPGAESGTDEEPVRPSGPDVSLLGLEPSADGPEQSTIRGSLPQPPQSATPGRSSLSAQAILPQLLSPQDLPSGFRPAYRTPRVRNDLEYIVPGAGGPPQLPQMRSDWDTNGWTRVKRYPSGVGGTTERVHITLVLWNPEQLEKEREYFEGFPHDDRFGPGRALELGDISAYQPDGGAAKVLDGPWDLRIYTYCQVLGRRGSPDFERTRRDWGAFTRRITELAYSRLRRFINSPQNRSTTSGGLIGGPGSGGGNLPGLPAPGSAIANGREEGSCMVACRQGVQPPKCAVACDGQTDTAFGKLYNHDYQSIEFGPASWDACAQRMRELDQDGW